MALQPIEKGTQQTPVSWGSQVDNINENDIYLEQLNTDTNLVVANKVDKNGTDRLLTSTEATAIANINKTSMLNALIFG